MTMTNPQFVVVVTGGGSLAIGNLLSQGGASSWFLEGLVPYAKASVDKFLGFEPEKYSSELTARQLAMQAFKRAIELGARPEEAVGVSATATLGKIEDEREGRKHSVYIGIQTMTSTESFQCPLLENRTRKEEEVLVAALIEGKVQHIRNATTVFSAPLSENDKSSIVYKYKADMWHLHRLMLLSGRGFKTVVDNCFPNVCDDHIIFPGSFNPIHEGHIGMVKEVYQRTGNKVYLEISIKNVDKPTIDYIDIDNRINNILSVTDEGFIQALGGIIISNTALFFDKIWMYPFKGTYIVGSDTVNRLFDRKYGNVPAFIDLMKDTDSKFIVVDREGHPLNIPNEYEFSKWNLQNRFNKLDNFQSVNISSTEIRKASHV